VIVPRSDRTIRASWMERAADDRLGVSAIIVDGGHCPHVSRPVQVAEIIDAIGNT
jgi:pimeloyl-ACP methyl ester carboxylesterase